MNVVFWLCASLWNTEVHLGPQWDVRKSSLRISCMILDGIIFSYRGKIVLEMTLFYSLQKQERCLRQLNEAGIAISILSLP